MTTARKLGMHSAFLICQSQGSEQTRTFEVDLQVGSPYHVVVVQPHVEAGLGAACLRFNARCACVRSGSCACGDAAASAADAASARIDAFMLMLFLNPFLMFSFPIYPRIPPSPVPHVPE